MKRPPTAPATISVRRLLVLTLLTLCSAARSSPVRAETPPPAAVQLDYRRAPGTESCPGGQALRERLARHLGYDPVHRRATERLTATIYRGAEAELHADMDIRDATGALL